MSFNNSFDYLTGCAQTTALLREGKSFINSGYNRDESLKDRDNSSGCTQVVQASRHIYDPDELGLHPDRQTARSPRDSDYQILPFQKTRQPADSNQSTATHMRKV